MHTALLGAAEKQDGTFVREAYLTYDSEAHPTQTTNTFGNYTTWLTYSGTFNEKTGSTSFPIDLTGHTVAGNAVLVVTGQPSDDTYQENRSTSCHTNPSIICTWNNGYWSNKYYSVMWSFCWGTECDSDRVSIGPFTHYPGTLGYQSYTTNPSLGGRSNTFSVTTYWKVYPVQVDYNIDGSAWETINANLRNTTTKTIVSITGGSHTLNFAESSSYNTKFSWTLYVPVDNSPDTYATTMQYDTYGNVTSITDAESNTLSFSYSSDYSYAYLTEIAAIVGSDTITTKATYDYYRGWITSIQQPKGVETGSGYDYLYTHDLMGRVTKKELPLLQGQSQRSYIEAVYDDTNRTVTIIDQLRHYVTYNYDKLGRLASVKAYTGTYGSGILYATLSYTYRYNDLISAVTDPGNETYTLISDFFGRSYSYDGLDRLTSASCTSWSHTYSYDKVGNRTSKDGIIYSINSVNEVTSLSDGTSFTYDPHGNRTEKTKGSDTWVYNYDYANRLTKVEKNSETLGEYVYDGFGRRIQVTEDGVTTTYIQAGLNVLYEENSTGSATYIYGPTGRIAKSAKTFLVSLKAPEAASAWPAITELSFFSPTLSLVR